MNTDSNSRQPPRHTLVLLLHAYSRCADDLNSVAAVIAEVWPQATIFRPQLPSHTFSMEDPNLIIVRLLADIDRLVKEAEVKGMPYENIVLVGHSLGALLARKLYVVACGESAQAPFESCFAKSGPVTSKPWAERVSRIVLLAGMNRGWRISHHLGLARAALFGLGSLYGFLAYAVSGRWPLIFNIRRGAEFITQLRIQWLMMRRAARESDAIRPGKALTIQLLGSRDDLVAPEDNVDLVSGDDFRYLDVPYSDHDNVVRMDDPRYGAGRKEVFLQALLLSNKQLEHISVIPSDEKFQAPDYKVKRMVFVIHGIRDVGHWTHRIARRVKQRAAGNPAEWATETSSYGYFPMLPFLFPWYRRQKVEWLMDQYTEALARYPNASFSYVGHSNGTYLLAKALELYPCCRFENVVFAGSVVKRDYNWQRFIKDSKQVSAVLNFVATGDWVVAFFPKLFQLLPRHNLGSAGHDGFEITEPSSGVYQAKFVKGGHGAAIEEPIWDTIADFVITGKVDVEKVPGRQSSRIWWISLLGKFPPIVWAAATVVLYQIWRGIQSLIEAFIDCTVLEAQVTGFSVAAYFLLLWLVVTRV
ncbi:MAG TPA: alpha/beta hydrolase [Gammaproteobacteria bacterium]|nr:alpha/beta hydrolase [Gammaproteobacteria bacterium]